MLQKKNDWHEGTLRAGMRSSQQQQHLQHMRINKNINKTYHNNNCNSNNSYVAKSYNNYKSWRKTEDNEVILEQISCLYNNYNTARTVHENNKNNNYNIANHKHNKNNNTNQNNNNNNKSNIICSCINYKKAIVLWNI